MTIFPGDKSHKEVGFSFCVQLFSAHIIVEDEGWRTLLWLDIIISFVGGTHQKQPTNMTRPHETICYVGELQVAKNILEVPSMLVKFKSSL